MHWQFQVTDWWPSSTSSAPDRSRFVILANGNIHEVSAAELKAPLPAASRKAPDACAVLAATEAQWALAQRRKEVVSGIDEAQNTDRQVAQIALDFGVSRRTVFRWIALYRQTPQTSALLPRARGTPVGAHRINARWIS